LVQFFGNSVFQFSTIVCVYLFARVALQTKSTFRLVVNAGFFGLLTWTLLFHGLEPYFPDASEQRLPERIVAGIAKITWWIAGAMVLISMIRLFLIFERKPHEGKLLQDVLVGIIYLGTGLSIIANVFGAPIGTLIATSGVFAIVLGLALQSTLNDVFSGIALNLGRPYTVGDWIVLDNGVEGRVVETTWRSTHLLDGSNDLVFVPNSALAKTRFVNRNSPDDTHGISLSVSLVPSKAPSEIEAVMRSVLLSSNVILKATPPTVAITGLTSRAIDVELTFRIANSSQSTIAKNEIFDLVYRHAKAAGLSLASAEGAYEPPPPVSPNQGTVAPHPSTAWRLLNAITLFSTLTQEAKEALAAARVRRTYRKDSTIVAQGSKSGSLMIVRSGVVIVERLEDARRIELARLAPGDCFGERGVLMGLEEPGEIRALTFAVIYEMALEPLATVMRDRPSIADELGLLLSRRLEAEKSLSSSAMAIGNVHSTSLAARIRHLFLTQQQAGPNRR
jgi:small-conductance mechanosensitive channel/CRP-like cAMP-binding protein